MIIMILTTSEYGLSDGTECSVHENQNIQDMIPETRYTEATGPSLQNNKRDKNVSARFLLNSPFDVILNLNNDAAQCLVRDKLCVSIPGYSQPWIIGDLFTMQQNKLFIGNLPFSSDESDLQQAFERFGEIDEIRVITDRETGRSRGFAFITFAESDNAQSALTMDGEELNGRPLRVNFATERNGVKAAGKTSGKHRNQNPPRNNA